MNNISLKELKSREINNLQLDFSEIVDHVNVDERKVRILSPVQVSGEILNTREGMYLDCNIKTAVEDFCSRCLKNMQVEIDSNVQGFLVEKGKEFLEEEEDIFVYDGESLNFYKIIEDVIALNIPQKLLCSEDCKGLCPGCGADLNVEECRCSEEEKDERLIDPRLEKLKELL